MKNLLFVAIILILLSCEKTIFVGGTVTDEITGDTISGLEMGLYKSSPEFSYDEKKWSDLELIGSATTNVQGYFSIEVDVETNMRNGIFYFPFPPVDTLSVNSRYRYSSSYSSQYLSPDYGSQGEFRLERPTLVSIELKNFTQKDIELRYGEDHGVVVHNDRMTVLWNKLLPGKKHKFEFYEVISRDIDTGWKKVEYLGGSTHYIKSQLPEDSDQIEWNMPVQKIVIDCNTLEKQ